MEKTEAQQHSYWLRSGFLSLSEKVVSMAFNLGTAMLLLRLLSKEAFAAWGIFILIGYFIEMGRSGLLQNGMVRGLASQKENPEAQAGIMSAAFLINLSFATLSNLVLWACADWIIQQYQTPLLAEMLPVFYLINYLMVFCTHFNFVQHAFFEFRGSLLTSVFYRGLPFLWVFWCWFSGHSLYLTHYCLALLAGLGLACIGSWRYAKPHLLQVKNVETRWFVDLIGYGKYVLGTNLSTMFYKNIDKLTLGQLLGPAAFAVYDAAGRVTQLVEAPAFSIAAVVFPKSAEKMALEGPSGVKELYEKSVGATLAVILPFVVFILLFAEPVIRIFAGERYLESAEILRVTAFFGLFMPFAVQFGTILDASGKPATNLLYTVFTALINLGLSYWYIRQFGLAGAAYATLTGYAISFGLMQFYLHRTFKINALKAFRYLPEFYSIAWKLLKRR